MSDRDVEVARGAMRAFDGDEINSLTFCRMVGAVAHALRLSRPARIYGFDVGPHPLDYEHDALTFVTGEMIARMATR